MSSSSATAEKSGCPQLVMLEKGLCEKKEGDAYTSVAGVTNAANEKLDLVGRVGLGSHLVANVIFHKTCCVRRNFSLRR